MNLRFQGNDDSLATIRKIAAYDLIIFATPVYWYAMSGTIKTFFRITDCLEIDKETGRKLRGKNMAAISCGSYNFENGDFFFPFENSAKYLEMNYIGHTHTWISEYAPSKAVIELIKEFSKKL